MDAIIAAFGNYNLSSLLHQLLFLSTGEALVNYKGHIAPFEKSVIYKNWSKKYTKLKILYKKIKSEHEMNGEEVKSIKSTGT